MLTGESISDDVDSDIRAADAGSRIVEIIAPEVRQCPLLGEASERKDANSIIDEQASVPSEPTSSRAGPGVAG